MRFPCESNFDLESEKLIIYTLIVIFMFVYLFNFCCVLLYHYRFKFIQFIYKQEKEGKTQSENWTILIVRQRNIRTYFIFIFSGDFSTNLFFVFSLNASSYLDVVWICHNNIQFWSQPHTQKTAVFSDQTIYLIKVFCKYVGHHMIDLN